MRVIALLALLFGFMAQMLLDGQVFAHAVFGIACGIVAIGCGLVSARSQHRYRSEAWVLAALGFLLGVWCIVALPSAYRRQETFNSRSRDYREKIDRQQTTPGKSLPTTNTP